MSGDVVARASRLTAGVEAGQWDVVREQGEFYGVYKGEFGRRVAGLIYDRREAEFIAATRTLVPELVAEVEKLRGALETIRSQAEAGKCRPRPSLALRDILSVIERAGIEP